MQFSNHSRRQDRLNWLAEIYRAYAADLQCFISNKVGDSTLAEDLTSTVFLKARGWLYTTARTTIVDYWQARTALVPPEASQICSFCGRSGSQVSRLFPAEVGTASSSVPSSGTFICDHCVKCFHTMFGTSST